MEKILVGLVVAMAGVLVYAFMASYKESQEWEKFKVEHQCKIVAKIDGSSTTAIGFGANGQVTVTPIYIAGKTGWQCNDGVTYYRSE